MGHGRITDLYNPQLVDYLGIIMQINRSVGTTSMAFFENYVYFNKRAVRRILGDCVAQKELMTIGIPFKLFSPFDFNNHSHVCMPI